MKKTLSLLLAVIIALSCMVCAQAADMGTTMTDVGTSTADVPAVAMDAGSAGVCAAAASNGLENFIDGFRPLPALTLNTAIDMSLDWDEIKIFTFAPTVNGKYYFYARPHSASWFDLYGYLVGPDYEIIDEGLGFNFARDLQAGQPYYLIIYAEWESSFKLQVTNKELPPFEIINQQVELKFNAVSNVWVVQLLDRNDYSQNDLIFQDSLGKIETQFESTYLWFLGGLPNFRRTMRVSTAYGQEIGKMTFVYKATVWEWIQFYLLFGWIWMRNTSLEDYWYPG